MKNGGRIPWTVAAFCETCRISCLMGKTPYERRFGIPLNGAAIPFGAMVEYHPISAEDISRLHQFGSKVLPGVLLGYVLYAGGIWKGDIMVADIEELEEMDASELHARRLNAKEILTPKRSGNFIFPVADGTVKIFGRGQRLRTSTLTQERPERGGGPEILQGKSGELRSPTPLHGDSTRDDEEAKSDFWTKTEDFMWNLESNCTCYPDDVHRRYQNDSYILGCIDGETN